MHETIHALDNHVKDLLAFLFGSGAHTATKYVSPKLTVKATRPRYKRGGFDKKIASVKITSGRPNHRERAFIKACLKAKEPFPVKKIQLSGLCK